MGNHGKKRWIRDWRGRLKRSTDRTQKDWQGALGARRSRDRILHRAHRRWSRTADACPQCTFLNKDRPIRAWLVTYDLGEIECYHLSDHRRYRALQKTFDVHVEDLGAVQRERPLVGRQARLWLETLERHPWMRSLIPHRYRLSAQVTVYTKAETCVPGVIKVQALHFHDDRTCHACRRKEDVAWRLHHTGAALRRRWQTGRSTKSWRKLEESYRRAEIHNLLHKARLEPEAYDDLVPTRIQKAWLD